MVIVALLIFGLPVSLPHPQKEQAVTVDLVPPPERSENAENEHPPAAEEPEPERSQDADRDMPSAGDQSARQEPSPAIRPVFQFGEEDAGPRESPDGSSSEDGSPAAPRDPDERETAEQPTQAEGEATDQAPPQEPPAADAQPPLELREAKTLFSQASTGRPAATTAMAGVPRPVRAGRLCLTELRAQLLNGSPPFFPDLLPSEWKNDGTTVDIPATAFRASGQWYNLGYRCSVDEDATKVVSFAFRVGEAIPRSEWKRRGLPSQ
ncbi:DUF930 domain-containing protein [Mesorhizobium sp. 1B3]|uniref:DUF930 domain-containing protein n=1 Tax=Mesorhizobium sp. 1B3 TaxID=3243599 RepID=UPI003D98F2CB